MKIKEEKIRVSRIANKIIWTIQCPFSDNIYFVAVLVTLSVLINRLEKSEEKVFGYIFTFNKK